jgi:hypothetical protein
MQDLVVVKFVNSFFVTKYNLLSQFLYAFFFLYYELIVLFLLYFLVNICQYIINIKIVIVNKIKYIFSIYCFSK